MRTDLLVQAISVAITKAVYFAVHSKKRVIELRIGGEKKSLHFEFGHDDFCCRMLHFCMTCLSIFNT